MPIQRIAAATGLASDPNTWRGGVPPSTGDQVIIPAGIIVTVDGTQNWGTGTCHPANNGSLATGTYNAGASLPLTGVDISYQINVGHYLSTTQTVSVSQATSNSNTLRFTVNNTLVGAGWLVVGSGIPAGTITTSGFTGTSPFSVTLNVNVTVVSTTAITFIRPPWGQVATISAPTTTIARVITLDTTFTNPATNIQVYTGLWTSATMVTTGAGNVKTISATNTLIERGMMVTGAGITLGTVWVTDVSGAQITFNTSFTSTATVYGFNGRHDCTGTAFFFAICVAGGLKASRTVNSLLNCHGAVFVMPANNANATNTGPNSGPAFGTLDYGTQSDPIPANITAEIALSKAPNALYLSGVNANIGMGISSLAAAGGGYTTRSNGIRFWGAPKLLGSTFAAPALASDTTITLSDSNLSTWAVGDWLFFGATTSNNNIDGQTARVITGISGNQVTLGASLGFNSHAGRRVFNMTRNVRVTCDKDMKFTAVNYTSNGLGAERPNTLEFGNVEFRGIIGCGVNSTYLPTSTTQSATSLAPTTAGAITIAGNATCNVQLFAGFSNVVIHDVLSISGSTVTALTSTTQLSRLGKHVSFTNNNLGTWVINNLVMLQASPYVAAGINQSTKNGGIGIFTNCASIFNNLYAVGCKVGPFDSTTNAGSNGVIVNGGYLEGFEQPYLVGGVSITYNNVVMDGLSFLQGGQAQYIGACLYNNCDIGRYLGIYNSTNVALPYQGMSGTWKFSDCFIPNTEVNRLGAQFGNTTTIYSLDQIADVAVISFKNVNNQQTYQVDYKSGGKIIRDNSVFYRGRSSLALSNWYSVNPLVYNDQTVTLPANSTSTIVGYIRINSAYTGSVYPNITVSGGGITPASFTSTGVPNVWEKFTLSVVNPFSYAVVASVVYTATSTSDDTANVTWFDGVAMDRFVQWTRHYGYVFNPTVTLQVVNPYTTLTESAAAALTNINFISGSLILSTAYNTDQIYAWLDWYECENQLDPVFTTLDGSSYTANCDLDASGGNLIVGAGNTITMGSGFTLYTPSFEFTGGFFSGTSNLPTFNNGTVNILANGTNTFNTTGSIINCVATGTYTFSGSYTGTLDLRNSSGSPITINLPFGTPYITSNNTGAAITVNASLTVTVSAPNLIAGTRVRLFNTTDNVELFNDVLSTNGFTYTTTFTANKNLNLRATYVNGLTAYLPIESTSILTSGGAVFGNTQVIDTVYAANNIAGASCTEFSSDFTNIYLNLSDSDGSTTVQRIYAYMAFTQHSAEGIRKMLFGMVAQDTENYVINVGVVNLLLFNLNVAPVMVIGGVITRSDGSTIIAATSNSIQVYSGKAYLANSAAIETAIANTLTLPQFIALK